MPNIVHHVCAQPFKYPNYQNEAPIKMFRADVALEVPDRGREYVERFCPFVRQNEQLGTDAVEYNTCEMSDTVKSFIELSFYGPASAPHHWR